jgi:DNA-binding response OmpR family regulator
MIILVEDNQELRQALGEYIALLGHDVNCFATGEAAMSCIRKAQRPPDLLIADIQLPGMNGLQLIDEARRDYPGTPVIVVSSFSRERGNGRDQSFPYTKFLQKPVPLLTFGQTILNALA